MTEYSFLEDYIAVQKLYPDAYLAGWSAASYWGFIDEISRDLIFFSPSVELQTKVNDVPVCIKKMPEKLCIETKKQFDETGFFYVSSPEKTVIDCLLYPDISGGNRQVFSILSNYRISEFYDQNLLLTLAKKFLPADRVSAILQFLKEGVFYD